ncbi:MAG: carbamoyltransferase HypF [Lentisphaerae bacterium GWF2_44_16]|nr:MAG: carbamoyltransferase HypF [Lentisphaerae bacterium GWF2_44_16]
MFERKIFELEGTVQGVGLRPFIYRLALENKLGGWIRNSSGKVILCVEGKSPDIGIFLEKLLSNLPSSARISAANCVKNEKIEFFSDVFEIKDSSSDDEARAVIPSDMAICEKCSAEILNPSNRRYAYPFTTCTACGPRYTVIDSMPYDRERTGMSVFPLCPDCLAEYENPADRRFHAESIACPRCGPELSLYNADAVLLPEKNPVTKAREILSEGKILALRGIGGYQLAADAFNRETIETLRQRKKRPHKPFAVMMRDVCTIRKFCELSGDAEKLLLSHQSPILILDIRKAISEKVPLELLSPDALTLGVMLPNSPLHKLLFEQLPGDAVPPFEMLVMTSGNRGGGPIAISNAEAFERLSGIADFFLAHDRDIRLRNDDSIVIFQNGIPQIWRRARGYAPEPFRLGKNLNKSVLAMGAELKNTIALGYDNEIVISPHVGDLGTPEALDGLIEIIGKFPAFLSKKPEFIAVDLNPDMHSSVIGRGKALQLGVPVLEVQHHHAHALSCMAEHNLEKGLALVFDGTGLGTDGKIWGAELLEILPGHFIRHATFREVPLPGGDAAVRQPARQLAGRFYSAGIEFSEDWRRMLHVSEEERAIWFQQCAEALNAPLSHAAGRLFDAFAALLRIAPDFITYEGQGAVRLEALAVSGKDFLSSRSPEIPFDSVEKNNMLFIDWAPLFRKYSSPDALSGYQPADLALGFHHAVASAALKMLEYAASKSEIKDLVLSGGVFMNRLLNNILLPEIKKMGLNVHIHQKIPPNDGGISLGQALCAGRG